MKSKTLILVFCLFLAVVSSAGAQVHKFQATGFTVSEKDNKGKWGKWSDFQKTSLVITLDADKNRIIVYSQEVQLYRIQSYGEREETPSDIIYPFSCIDDNGEKFAISIITRKKQGNRKQLYINHKNVIIAYNISNFKG
jgi:hypothetical protein